MFPFAPERLLWIRKTRRTPGGTPTVRERTMKTPIIAVAVLAYAILTTLWICYAELMLP
jgi:hypothetical protein